MNHGRGIEGWLDEPIMCGWPWPVTRRSAAEEMVKEGMTWADAIAALCWYRAVAQRKPVAS